MIFYRLKVKYYYNKGPNSISNRTGKFEKNFDTLGVRRWPYSPGTCAHANTRWHMQTHTRRAPHVRCITHMSFHFIDYPSFFVNYTTYWHQRLGCWRHQLGQERKSQLSQNLDQIGSIDQNWPNRVLQAKVVNSGLPVSRSGSVLPV